MRTGAERICEVAEKERCKRPSGQGLDCRYDVAALGPDPCGDSPGMRGVGVSAAAEVDAVAAAWFGELAQMTTTLGSEFILGML